MQILAILISVCLALTSATGYYGSYRGYGYSNGLYYGRGLVGGKLLGGYYGYRPFYGSTFYRKRGYGYGIRKYSLDIYPNIHVGMQIMW